MAENNTSNEKKTFENIGLIRKMFSDSVLQDLQKQTADFEKGVKDFKSSLEEKRRIFNDERARREEEALKAAAEKTAAEKVDSTEAVKSVSAENSSAEKVSAPEKPAEIKTSSAPEVKTEEKQQVKAEVKLEDKPIEKPQVKAEDKPTEKPQVKAEDKPIEKPQIKAEDKPIEKPQVKAETKPEAKPEAKSEIKPETAKPETAKSAEATARPSFTVPPTPARPSFIVRREGKDARPAGQNASRGPAQGTFGGYQGNNNRNNNGTAGGFNRGGAQGTFGGGYNRNNNGAAGGFNRGGQGAGTGFNRNASGAGTGFNRNASGAGAGFKKRESYVAPAILPTTNEKRTVVKKKIGEKSYEEKHTLNKRALIKSQVSIDDFDENKSGYRKFRPVKKAKDGSSQIIKIEKAIITTEIIPLKVLSEKIGITAAEITKRLFKEGIMKTINDSVDFDTAAFIADDIGVELELKLDKTAEDVLSEGFDLETEGDVNLVLRPPVVTVMGHVDHGKTSLLDRIRKANVTAGEAGGITQHIGAYQVVVNKKQITFLDTPGHAAFTAMRARGAQATDIAVLVVAADDGIMPQTIEAINHAKAANVPIIVAVNKIDKPEANIERIKTQLTDHGILPEEWGGDAIICPVSAKTGEGIDQLLESINLVAEIKDLRANPHRKAKGVVIEAKLDQNKGPVATVLIQNGTLKVSDSVIVGMVTGKIRAMTDYKGCKVGSAGPSVPVSVMGLDDVPNAGDILYAVEQEKLTKLVAEERKNKEREGMIKSAAKVTLDDVFNKIAEGEMKGLNIVVKADVQGSVEAVKQSLEKLSTDEVKVNVIHAAAGAINESDIMLAESSHAIIIGFNVRPDANAKNVAEHSGVDIKLYRVIYEAIEDVQKALKGMLAPKTEEVYLGKAEVREVFKITGVGQVAGCYVVDGKILRSGKLRIYRDDVMITEGDVLQLKRFKDDVKEVAQGFECGISIEKFNDIKVGDFIECYNVEEKKA